MSDDRLMIMRQGDGFVPCNEMTLEEMRSYPEGKPLLMKAPVQARKPRQHNLAWKLAAKVAEAGDHYDARDAMDHILIAARWAKTVINPFTGEIEVKPKSIAWHNVGQEKFERIFKRMISVITTKILPGVDDADLRREVEDLMDGEEGRRMREQNERFGR